MSNRALFVGRAADRSERAGGPWFVVMLVAALLLGALQNGAYVHTEWWPLPLLSMAGLLLMLQRCRPGQAAWLGWLYGVGGLAAGVWWLFISMHHYGGLPAPLAAAAVLALSGALALYGAGAAWAYARCHRGRADDVLLWATLWLLAEWCRGVLFTGFPWVGLGYSQLDGPLAALAPWVGVYGMAAAAAGLAAALALLVGRLGSPRARWPAVVGAVLCGVLALLPTARFTSSNGEFTVDLLQPNIKQDEKFVTEHLPRTLAWVASRLRDSRADLVVSPETAIPLLPHQLESFAPGLWAGLQQHFASAGRVAIVGVPLGDAEKGYTNSVLGLSAGPVYRYDKHHLVPFGEFIPTGFRWFTELMNIPLGDFNRGSVAQPPLVLTTPGAAHTQRLAPNICYEDLFGEELARRFIDPATAPTAMVNISNIAWFGDTVAIPQHLNISRARALEFQLPMVRATNTGATAVVDHLGRVQAQLPPLTEGVLSARVQGRLGTTPFAWWAARWGLWPVVLLAAATLLLLLAFAPRQRSGASSLG